MREDWSECLLGEISSKITKGSTPTTYGYKYQKEGINFIKIENVIRGRIDKKSIYQFISEEAHESQKRSQLEEGDVLFSIAGTIGETCLITKDILPANTNQAFAIISGFNKALDANFLRKQLDSFVSRKLKDKARGGAMNNVSLTDLKELNLVIPPLAEQNSIISKIEELFSDLDEGIADLKKAQDQLKVYRQAVLKKAFEGKLTNTTLDSLAITELGKILTGNTPTKKDSSNYDSADYNFYKPTDLDAGNNVIKSNDFLSKKGFENSRQVPALSILVTCIGATIGKTGLIKSEGGFNQQINAIVPFENYMPEFIFYQAISIDFQTQIKTNASSTTLPILNKGKFSKLRMNVCSLKEQHQIVQEIESRLSVCDKVEESITESLEKAKALRQSILKKAFEGTLLSEEEIAACKAAPDYEPASILLEKIKAEKKKK